MAIPSGLAKTKTRNETKEYHLARYRKIEKHRLSSIKLIFRFLRNYHATDLSIALEIKNVSNKRYNLIENICIAIIKFGSVCEFSANCSPRLTSQSSKWDFRVLLNCSDYNTDKCLRIYFVRRKDNFVPLCGKMPICNGLCAKWPAHAFAGHPLSRENLSLANSNNLGFQMSPIRIIFRSIHTKKRT